jgi:hypothetical protein
MYEHVNGFAAADAWAECGGRHCSSGNRKKELLMLAMHVCCALKKVLHPSHFTRRFGEERGAVKMLLTRTVAVSRFIVESLNLDSLMQC